MKKIGLIFILFIFVVWFVGLVIFDYRINHFSFDKTAKTDAIVVLTGGRHRLAEAIRLLNEGFSNKLFISGVQKNISLKDLEKRNGIKIVSDREIVLDRVAANTFENARETDAWIKQHQIKSIRLVTSNYHVLRSLIEFRRRNKDIKIVIHPVFSENIATSWWKSFYSFYFLAQEYNKFIVAYLRAIVFNV